MTGMTIAGLTQHFTDLAKTPERHASDALSFIEDLQKSGVTHLNDAQRVMGRHVLKELEDSTEHFVYAAATSAHIHDELHKHIEEKAESVYRMADRLREILDPQRPATPQKSLAGPA